MELEVATRTIYRDMAELQASRVPIDGEAGVGYILRPGYDLPPLMFNAEQVEALVLGLAMVMERGDPQLIMGAQDALAKIHAVVPQEIAGHIEAARALVPHPLESGVSFGEHLSLIRLAIRKQEKLRVTYRSRVGNTSKRTIWPLGLYLYSHVTLLCAKCERADDFRTFRTERVTSCERTGDRFDGKNGALLKQCLARFQGAGLKFKSD